MVAVAASSQAVTLGGIVGQQLALNKAFATLPQAFHIFGIAIFTIPAAMLMRRFGRPRGFASAALIGVASQLLSAWAIFQQSFWMFTTAITMLGFSTAFAMQLRFAAAESVTSTFAARAISFVLAGAIGGAFVGPYLASRGSHLFAEIPYAGGFIIQAGLFMVIAGVFLTLKITSITESSGADNVKRPLTQVVAQPVFLVAMLAGVTSYVVMSLMMTATPLSMHIKDGFTLTQTADVIRAHVVGMYAPSLISGYLIDRFGIAKMMLVGISVLIVCILIALAGHQYLHYWWALLLLGVGWNFLYVSGTTLLTKSYRPSERYGAQAVNDFTIFGMSATGALMAGVLIHTYGWNTTVKATILPVILLSMGLWLVRKDAGLRARPAAVS